MKLSYINTRGLSCFEACCVTIANSLQLNYRISFLYSLSQLRKQNTASPLLGARFELEEKFIFLYMELLTGMKAIEVAGLSEDNSLELIKSCMRLQKPVILSFDIFYCPWSTAFQKSHYLHNVIVTEYLGQKKGLICQDPMLKQTALLPLRLFVQACHSFYIVTTVQPEEFAYEDILRLSVGVLTKRDYFNSLQSFYTEFSLLKDMSDEYQNLNGDYWSCSLFRILSYGIPGARMLYGQFLEEIGSRLGQEISEIGKGFADLSTAWINLSGLILKLHYLGTYQRNKSRVCQQMQAILLNEMRLLQSLRSKVVT